LHGRQPAEKPPRQPGVIAKDNLLRSGNHAGYIAVWSAPDNERDRIGKDAINMQETRKKHI
jgi:hypothetical protein